jgi:hypothetical protein
MHCAYTQIRGNVGGEVTTNEIGFHYGPARISSAAFIVKSCTGFPITLATQTIQQNTLAAARRIFGRRRRPAGLEGVILRPCSAGLRRQNNRH